jgi:hypothetical protein
MAAVFCIQMVSVSLVTINKDIGKSIILGLFPFGV